jgi:hypothetical protein
MATEHIERRPRRHALVEPKAAQFAQPLWKVAAVN